MSKQLVIRNGFILYSNNEFSNAITGITDYQDYVDQGNSLNNNDYKLATEYAIKEYIETKFADSGTTSSGPEGTIQLADNSADFTGYTNFSYDGSILSVPNINTSGNITGDTAFLSTLYIDTTEITSIDEDNITSDNNNTLATTSAITSYVAQELAAYPQTLSALTDTVIDSLSTDDFLVYNGTNWVNTGNSYLETLLDSVYVNVDGDTMTGDLTLDTGSNLTLTQGDINVNDGDVTILGDLYVSGTTTTINSQDLNISDNIILINSGETGSGVTLNDAGIVIERGDYQNYYFMFVEDSPKTDTGGTFRIGLSGDTQAVATREDNPINNGIAVWNDFEKRFDTDSNFTWNSGNTTLTVNGDVSITGTVDGVDISDFYDEFNTFTGSTNTLENLNDTDITTPETENDVLQWDGSNWVNSQNLNISGNLIVTGSTTLYGGLDVTDGITTDTLNASGNITGLTIYGTTIEATDINTTNLTLGTGTEVNNITTDISSNIDDDTLATTSAVTSYVSQVISDSGVTILDNADTRVLTANGDNNELQANSGMTFDGTDLTLTDMSGTGDRLIYADSTGKLIETNEYIYKPQSVTNGTGTDTVDNVNSAITHGVVWHYYVSSGNTNYRSGIITSVWGNGSLEMNETSTIDIGNTTPIDFNVVFSGSTVELESNISAGTWNIKVVRMVI
jgi:hypothetical protein